MWRTESQPNVSGAGFIDKSPYAGPRTQLQSKRNRSEVRVARVMERFGRLRTEVNELITSQVISPDIINRQFNFLHRVMQIWPKKQDLSFLCVERLKITKLS